ncbi:MAG: hypothetical protein D8M58_12190 [Calditrichaeota bacterium]|nr:MAG: hypothetical protein DWQ03_12975 [Calditrichota bacterium]MBL1206156.1 hypothetical protein [Calditrichota bacterium]NOG45981.1 hypothetical protein [Calditrichota bacterium]
MSKLTFILAIFTSLIFSQTNDGKIFDTGFAMEEISSKAPSELKQATWMIGSFDVKYTIHTSDTSEIVSTGKSVITLMNRGHGLMERYYSKDFNKQGTELNTISMLVYNPTQKKWLLGNVDSYKEQCRVYDGDLTDDSFILYHANRDFGWINHRYYKMLISKTDNGLILRVDNSADYGKTWVKGLTKEYTRTEEKPSWPQSKTLIGEAAEGLPDEARQFDFLLGEFEGNHTMQRPNGPIRFKDNSTAVHVMNGHAIMEFSWFDTDPNLPDAATTIIRIYNRAMRRWESLFFNNRGHSLLYFGGVKEDDKIVLHSFNAHSGTGSYSYWVFFNWQDNSYQWRSEDTRDRGKTVTNNWVIDFVRKAK